MVVDAAGRASIGNFGFDLMSGAPIRTAGLIRCSGTDATVSGSPPSSRSTTTTCCVENADRDRRPPSPAGAAVAVATLAPTRG
jgi:hypothetical protein